MSDPTELQSTPSLREFVERKIDARLAGLRVSLPAEVLSYDAATGCVDAQPLIDQAHIEDGERVTERLPIVTDVPIVFFGGKGNRDTFPLERGDIVLLVFASSSIARWKVTGKGGDPGDDRHHRLSDALAIPFSRGATHESARVMVGDDIRLGGEDADEKVAWHSALEDLKQVFSDWVVAPTDGGGALKTLLTALIDSGWPRGATNVKAK